MIFPDPNTGGVVIRDINGNPTNPANVQGAYVPPALFVASCPLTALPSDCTARIEPKQINAIVSELVSFAQCLDADGPWNCSSPMNICAAFNVWANNTLPLKADITYVNQQDALRLLKAGDTMTGPLTLAADPAAAMQPATKQYVDAANALQTTQTYVDNQDNLRVLKSGDTMTGPLLVNNSAGSTSPGSGALRVTGGVGIGGDISFGGVIRINSTAFVQHDASYNYLAGPDGVTRLSLGTNAVGINLYNQTAHYFRDNSGTLQCRIDDTGITVQPLTASTSTSTGALIVVGGVGIGGTLNAAGTIATQAALSCAGTLNVGNNCNMQGNIAQSSAGDTWHYFQLNGVNKFYIGNDNVNNMFRVWNATNGFSISVYGSDGSVAIGSPAGGSKGAGTLNVQSGVYDGGSRLTCFGIQYLKHGYVDLAQWDSIVPTGKHDLAHRFVAELDQFDPRDPDQYIEKMLHDEALPGMPTFGDWKHNELSLGEMHNKLWLAVELLASAYVGTHKRLAALEAKMGM